MACWKPAGVGAGRSRRGAASCCAPSTSSTGWASEGVSALLGEGRKDESGDFTKGAGLSAGPGRSHSGFCRAGRGGRGRRICARSRTPGRRQRGRAQQASHELEQIVAAARRPAAMAPTACMFDTGMVRGPRLLHRRGVRGAAHLPGSERRGRGRRVRLGRRAAGAMTIWWRASPASRCRPPASPSASAA